MLGGLHCGNVQLWSLSWVLELRSVHGLGLGLANSKQTANDVAPILAGTNIKPGETRQRVIASH